MKYDIVTVGGAVEDIAFCTREGQIIDNRRDILRQRLLAFEYGAKIVIEEAEFNFGGGAANVSVCASRLGLKAAAMCCIGDCTRSDRIFANLEEQGVATEFVQREKSSISGFSVSLVLIPDNEHTIFTYRGANDNLKLSARALRDLDTEYLYICSLSGAWRKNVQTIFKYAKRYNICWNPGSLQLSEGASLVRGYLKNTYAIILNQDEATELVVTDKKFMSNRKHNATFLNNVKNLLRIIHSYGPQLVVITRGRAGADVYDGNDFYHVNIIESKRMDTTGVGDAFGSSFVSGLHLFDGDVQKAMELGIKNTASVISKRGAQQGLLKL